MREHLFPKWAVYALFMDFLGGLYGPMNPIRVGELSGDGQMPADFRKALFFAVTGVNTTLQEG